MINKHNTNSRQALEKEDDLPRSNCSIEAEPCEKRVAFNIWAENNKAKHSHKEISDRFLPLRRMPASSKNLMMECEDTAMGE